MAGLMGPLALFRSDFEGWLGLGKEGIVHMAKKTGVRVAVIARDTAGHGHGALALVDSAVIVRARDRHENDLGNIVDSSGPLRSIAAC